MIARQIGIVLCRVGAAVLTVQAIRSLGYTLPSLFYGDDQFLSEALAFTLLSAVPGLGAIGLWVFADRISGITESPEPSAEQEALTGLDLTRIGTALVGMWLAISAVVNGVFVEVSNLNLPDLGAEAKAMMDENAARVIGIRASYIVQLAIGIALILGRNRISTMLVESRSTSVHDR